uniref:O-methyltransferase domain-containing protein n=1 Tax=Mycena chlorophos TaxID=658473 RepID=A0ABQ0MFH0_MYCCL|nr:predicted protein [Mycena chlorophos]
MATDGLTTMRALAKIINESLDTVEAAYSKAGVTVPSLDAPFDPANPAEKVREEPAVATAFLNIMAATSQLGATVRAPAASVLDASQSFHIAACLRTASEINVVEILRDAGPQGLHVKDIAAPSKADPALLARILRLLATHNIFREVSPNVFANNRISSAIDKGKSPAALFANRQERLLGTNGLAALVEFFSEDIFKASAWLADTVLEPKEGQLPYNKAFGTDVPLYYYMQRPENLYRLQRFGLGMQGTAATEAPDAIFTGFEWDSLPSGAVLVDVGGGNGFSSMTIAQKHPKIKVVVQDLDQAIEGARSLWKESFPTHVEKNLVEFQAHDFFKPQPVKDADVFFLRYIAHNWNDGLFVKILQNLRDVAKPSTKLIIHPKIKVVVQDLDQAIEGAKSLWKESFPSHVEKNLVEFQAHDFFKPQPVKDADVFFLRYIAHNWNDGLFVKILQNLRDVAKPSTKLIIVEKILSFATIAPATDIPGAAKPSAPAPLLPNWGVGTAEFYLYDVAVHNMLGGGERTLDGFVDVLALGKWKVVSVHHTKGSQLSHIVAVPITNSNEPKCALCFGTGSSLRIGMSLALIAAFFLSLAPTTRLRLHSPSAMPREQEDCSDSDDDGSKSSGWLQLGISGERIPAASEDLTNVAISRIGGQPAFLHSNEPAFTSSFCKLCGLPMELLVQLWCPIEEDSPYDRVLYIWGCSGPMCQQSDGSIRAWRSLRYNDEYAAKIQAKKEKAPTTTKSRPNPFTPGASALDATPFGLGAQIFGSDAPLGLAEPEPDEENESDSDSDSEPLVVLAESTSENSPWHSAPRFDPVYLSRDLEPEQPSARSKLPSGVQMVDSLDDSRPTGDNDFTDMAEAYENTLHIDQVFDRFTKRVGLNSAQCLRYELEGTPLPYASDNVFETLFPLPASPSASERRVYGPTLLAPCPICGAERVFECQLMPNLINLLRADTNNQPEPTVTMSDEQRRKFVAQELKGGAGSSRGMNWGTCLVFSCSGDCCVDAEGQEARDVWCEELVLVQWGV